MPAMSGSPVPADRVGGCHRSGTIASGRRLAATRSPPSSTRSIRPASSTRRARRLTVAASLHWARGDRTVFWNLRDHVTSMALTPPIFTPADQLRLLQLQARRAISERLVREQLVPLAGESETSEDEQSASLVPDVWRLVPSDVSLHAWQAECLTLWLRHGRGTAKVATGGGKTILAMAAVQELHNQREPDLRVAIIVPTIPLMLQWVDELRKGNLPDSAVGMMGGGEDRRILVCVLSSARERLPRLVEQAGWSDHLLLVVDECHRANAEQARRIFESKPAFTLGLSATPEDADDDLSVPSNEAYASSAVGQGLGPIIYEFTLRQCLDAGLLTPFELWHIGLPLMDAERREHASLSREISELRSDLERRHRIGRSKVSFLPWCQALAQRNDATAAKFTQLTGQRKRLLYRAFSRLAATRALLQSELVDPESRAITFHESVDEVEKIFLDVLEEGIPAVLEHSKLPTLLRRESIEAFRAGTARAVISAKSLVEGFNVPSADVGIIVASTSSVRQRIQSLGRMLRHKEGGRPARIFILYISKSEDESIYEKTDWDAIVGATVNRYFLWTPPAQGEWLQGLRETGTAPRRYLPPSSQVEVSALEPGGPYPGRPDGVDLKLDQDDNLRVVATNQLVPASRDMVKQVLRNSHRRAHCTWAGHLIVRFDDSGPRATWHYVGPIRVPEQQEQPVHVDLRIRSRSGRPVIARAHPGGGEDFAIGPEDTVRDLHDWTTRIARERGARAISTIYWDQGERYWVEVEGNRVYFDGAAAPLKF
ncbi:MAG: DEAD/DEAH box helicase [Deltaproteobacteria bacterium]|nr:MAG: DEAD/DEAH box helicase [Deltaproteobacteria bacterium]